jgi:hypothetical protein
MDQGIQIDPALNLIHSLSRESDRGCTILVGAFLDDLLEELHKTKMRAYSPSNKIQKDLFEGHGPLASSSGKSKAAQFSFCKSGEHQLVSGFEGAMLR